MFTYDWFNKGGLTRQTEEAKKRCAVKRFPDGPQNGTSEYAQYMSELETRTIVYLKDGLSYEMYEICDLDTSTALAFECVPVDESYRVGAYVIIIPFEDIARVEVFAVHPDEKPQETLKIPGFRSGGGE